MRRSIIAIVVCSILFPVLILCASQNGFAQVGSVRSTVIMHMNLTLDKSILPTTGVMVRLHARDAHSDTYYTSPIDADNGTTVNWRQDLPFSVSETQPLQMTLQTGTSDGVPLPAGYTVQWQYAVGSGAYKYMNGDTATVAAGKTEDATVTVRGTIVAAQ